MSGRSLCPPKKTPHGVMYGGGFVQGVLSEGVLSQICDKHTLSSIIFTTPAVHNNYNRLPAYKKDCLSRVGKL